MGTAFLRNINIYKKTTVQKIVSAFKINMHVFKLSASSTSGYISPSSILSLFSLYDLFKRSLRSSALSFFGAAGLDPPEELAPISC